MKVGIGIGAAADPAAEARAAEAAGFDAVHCGEHVFFHGPTPNALVTLALAAGATSGIRLVSAVTLAPLYPAALLAKMATTLDVASAGRLDLGVGIGGEFPPEFAAVGVPVDERGVRADEVLAVLRALFAGAAVDYHGRWTHIDRQRLNPPPAQPGGPPLWLAGRKGAALRRAGRFADVWMPYMLTPESFAEGLDAVRDAARDAGRAAAAVDGAFYGFVCVDEDGDRARRDATAFVGNLYRQSPERFARFVVAGTPDECVARLHEYEGAGASTALLNLACPPAGAETTMRLLAEILPQIQAPMEVPT